MESESSAAEPAAKRMRPRVPRGSVGMELRDLGHNFEPTPPPVLAEADRVVVGCTNVAAGNMCLEVGPAQPSLRQQHASMNLHWPAPSPPIGWFLRLLLPHAVDGHGIDTEAAHTEAAHNGTFSDDATEAAHSLARRRQF